MSQIAVVEVPQWQGSGAATARRLRDGARLLAGLVPAAEHLRVDVPDEPGDVLATNAEKVRTALDRARGRLTVTVGGDCGVELAPIAAAVRRHGERLAVVWFDAHGDLNTPESSPSGAFHGMVLRTLLGEGPSALVPDRPLRRDQVVLAGVRALDPAERAYAEGLPVVTDAASLPAAVGDADAVYVHIDLDVLDPDVFASVGTPEAGGLTPGQVVGMVTALAERFEIAGLGITEYEPARPQDQETLAGLVGPVADACAASVVREVERRAFAAWPASTVTEEGGWLLRHTPGVGRRRSNSAVPVAEPSIDHLEAFYRARGLPAMVQLGPAHQDLDAALAERGYRMDAPTSVMTAVTSHVVDASGTASTVVDVAETPDAWLKIFVELNARGDSAEVGEKVISRIAAPAAFLSVTRDGLPAGMGLVAADSGWAGMFSMATRPDLRGQGIATAVLGAGARWAAHQGATRLYLQVEDDNDTARRLYSRAGFTRSYGYHYRIDQARSGEPASIQR
ncbi:GNAT family N-acetyltransferase [Actinoallomurus acaciae]|uniref:GNAT family N-acetyltransferase n=1 Tax=Actinoallomurus acaciae TaxID=502577 RepID=A0ABV5Y6K3_9ACTN